ncbi:putative metalloprotease CJM1_0395 family protein [Teredinibacter purpureus]|uniref:putative metalloprotease CJM1_0395 family protein n=1 Tax=Teredinibacter purpureus TaxID=2731756 RepID=UPI0005F7DC77|nr:putative metalloprotease CJM1_0395 family protein [Teredinibacter purpureus]
MIGSHLPAPLANQIAVFNPSGQPPEGDERASARDTTLKPVEPLAASGRQQLRSGAADSPPLGVSPDKSEEAGQGLGTILAGDSSGNDTEDTLALSSEVGREQDAREARQLELDQREISRLASRDREVRAHEQAHSSVGGQHAGAAQYQYENGPDGVRYAVGGEVPINVGREASPEATLRKAEIVKRAALAPAEPSPQDRRVAAEASRLQADAQREIIAQQTASTEESDSSDVDGNKDGVIASNGASTEDREPASRSDDIGSRSVRAADNIVSSRLSQGIANTSLSSREPGTILDQLV